MVDFGIFVGFIVGVFFVVNVFFVLLLSLFFGVEFKMVFLCDYKCVVFDVFFMIVFFV